MDQGLVSSFAIYVSIRLFVSQISFRNAFLKLSWNSELFVSNDFDWCGMLKALLKSVEERESSSQIRERLEALRSVFGASVEQHEALEEAAKQAIVEGSSRWNARIRLTVVCARGLHAKDRSGTSDPYALFVPRYRVRVNSVRVRSRAKNKNVEKTHRLVNSFLVALHSDHRSINSMFLVLPTLTQTDYVRIMKSPHYVCDVPYRYVTMQLEKQKRRTRTILADLNPIWNETFELCAHHREQRISFRETPVGPGH